MFGLRCAGTLLTPGIIDPSRNKSYAWSDLANDSGAVWTSQATCEKQSVMFKRKRNHPGLLPWYNTVQPHLQVLSKKKNRSFYWAYKRKEGYIPGGERKDLEWARKKPTVLSRNLLNPYANRCHSKALSTNKFYHSSMWQKYPYGHRCVVSLFQNLLRLNLSPSLRAKWRGAHTKNEFLLNVDWVHMANERAYPHGPPSSLIP